MNISFSLLFINEQKRYIVYSLFHNNLIIPYY